MLNKEIIMLLSNKRKATGLLKEKSMFLPVQLWKNRVEKIETESITVFSEE